MFTDFTLIFPPFLCLLILQMNSPPRRVTQSNAKIVTHTHTHTHTHKHTRLKQTDSLDVVVFRSEVREHVTVVTVHVPAEHLDVVFGAELVHAHHQVPRTTRQTHL